MDSYLPKLARVAICAAALTVVPAILPAQTNGSNNMSDNSAAATSQNSDLVPGTGMTAAELQDIGYSQQQISQIRTDMLAEANGGPMDQNASSNSAGSNANMQTNDAANSPSNQAGKKDSGSGNWGLLGLFGLLGLLGARRRHHVETVHDERDRDVRRIA